ncbi:serine/threonine protein kinase, variant 1 [Aphanomyces invadans]|nr:serine/threonine protein kinase, variant 1 [Aphanomyces invadans]ETW03372.1 serine/threonine protein kinase, variant 1 [Aphanomyces invadans]|eukprot:XP_008867601.1 serine/threonine protein kinase, variant 1 [Aphanomyces invadans]
MGRHILHWACAAKKELNLNLLQLVLTLDPVAATRSDMNGHMPLHVLVSNRLIHVEALQLVLSAYSQAVDVIDASGQSPFHALCANESVNLAMLHALMDATSGHLSTCLRWLDDEKSSALHILCTNHRATSEMVQLVLQGYPASAQLVDVYGSTPFHYVCASPAVTVDLVWLFLDKCPAVCKLVDQRGKTPLHYICANPNVTPDLISIVFDAYPTSSQVMDHAMKLPVHYVIENAGIPSDMAYRLLANGSAYRLRYDIHEVPHTPHACITGYYNNTTASSVYCATDTALDSRTSQTVVLHYFSDRTTFQQLLSTLAQLDISVTDASTTTVALIDSFENARKRIRMADASPILDYCLVMEHPHTTVHDMLARTDPQTLITSLGQCVSHWHTTAGIAHGNITPRSIGYFQRSASGVFKLVPSLTSQCIAADMPRVHFPLMEPLYCAPEIAKALLTSPYAVPTLSSDMWQFGCTMYEVVTGVPLVTAIAPFSAMLPPEQLYHVIASLTDTVLGHILAPLPPDIRDMLSHLLQVDPTTRWTIDRVMGVAGVTMRLLHHPPPEDLKWSMRSRTNEHLELEAAIATLGLEVEQLTQGLLQAKTQLRHVELDRDALQRQLCELVDHLNVVLEEKEESRHLAAVAEAKRASLSSQLDTMVQMVISVIPLAQRVYGQSSDDYLAHAMADAAHATVKPAYALDRPGENSTSTLVGLLKEHVRRTLIAKGCIAKWSAATPPPFLEDHPFLEASHNDSSEPSSMYL